MNEGGNVDNINWDQWQEEVDEQNPDCPWVDGSDNE